MKFSIRGFLLDVVGVNRAIIYTVGARLIQGCGGIFTLFFISKYLSVNQQGYYYTFGSILALQLFFEMGLSGILSQFTAHEAVHLRWNSYRFEGSEFHLKRLSSLIRFSLKWFGVAALFLFIFLLISGFLFFDTYSAASGVDWKYPWILLVSTTALNLFVTPLLSYLEGLGRVKDVARMRLIQQCVSIVCVWLALIGGGGLFAAGIASLVTILVALVWLLSSNQYRILKSVWENFDKHVVVSWKKEIFPYQWKIAVSWMSGYLSFSAFNPIIFATEGVKMAGQMGMTMTVLSGIMSLSLSWITTQVPQLSGYIALKEFSKSDNLFFKTFKQGSLICAISSLLFIGGLEFICEQHLEVTNRFLPIAFVIILTCINFINVVVTFLATYLRCFKKEPFLYMSLAMGISITISSIFLGDQFGIWGIISGYCGLSLLMYLPWAITIFITKKHEWIKQ